MAVICPTVTAYNEHTYRLQIERIAGFVHRVHLDFMDDVFTPKASPNISKAWWPVGVRADLHVMYKNPGKYIKEIVGLSPNLVIIHAEADGDFHSFHDELKQADIKVGLALLKDTPVSRIEPVLDLLDHVLIFSGELGSFGGRADFSLLDKVKELKDKSPGIEIGWDGGVNQHNVKQLAEGRVDVLNVGGFIQRSQRPDDAYATLEALVGSA